MPWSQIYDPFNAWPLSTAIAALPVLTLFFVLIVLKQRVWVSALAGMAMAMLLALVVFGMPAPLVGRAAVLGAVFGLLRIAWNRAISRRRGIANWLRRATPISDVAEPAASGGQHASVHNAELQAHTVRAIQALSPKLRDALLLVQSGEYQYDEIARMLGIPAGTVKWRVSEARRKVRGKLAALGYVDAK